jgi:three-Cys-motif partner protein
MSADFFASPKPNSIIKQQIILSAFKIWLTSNKKSNELSYIDLFSGPGIYEDGSFSTPFLILQEICSNNLLAGKFNVLFNDNRKSYLAKLRKALNGFKNISNLKLLMTASETIINKVPTKFSNLNLDNSFVFIDAWGCQGINRNYIQSLLKNPNCAIALFFNINQIPRFINSARYDFEELFKNVFDKKSINKIKTKYKDIKTGEKEKFLLDTYLSSLTNGMKNIYTIPFKFCRNNSLYTSHYMIFIMRSEKQYGELLKQLTKIAKCPLKQLCRSEKCKSEKIKCNWKN